MGEDLGFADNQTMKVETQALDERPNAKSSTWELN
jgi:hypothetical protein